MFFSLPGAGRELHWASRLGWVGGIKLAGRRLTPIALDREGALTQKAEGKREAAKEFKWLYRNAASGQAYIVKIFCVVRFTM
jgi:hypothetical protein